MIGCHESSKLDINSKEIVARINNEPIYLGDVYRRIEATFGNINKKEINEDRWKMIFETAFESELIDKLLLMEARKEKLSVSPEVIKNKLEAVKNSMGEENFKRMLKKRRANEDDFIRFLEERELIEIYKSRLFDQIEIDDKTLREYYEGHKREYIEPEKVRLEVIRVDDEKISEEIFRRWRGGENFEKLSEEYKSKGKDKIAWRLRPVPLKELPEEIAYHIKNGGDGEVLAPIRSGDMIYIIKILEKIPSKQLDFEKVKEKIRQLLISRKEQLKIEEWYQSKLKDITIEYLMKY